MADEQAQDQETAASSPTQKSEDVHGDSGSGQPAVVVMPAPPPTVSQKVKSAIDGLVASAKAMETAQSNKDEAQAEADAASVALSGASSRLSSDKSSFVSGCNTAIGAITELRDSA